MKLQVTSVFESQQSFQNVDDSNDFIDTRLKKDVFLCVLVYASLSPVKQNVLSVYVHVFTYIISRKFIIFEGYEDEVLSRGFRFFS